MQRWFFIVSFFICHTALGQIKTLNNCLQWFEKGDKASVRSLLPGEDFKLLEEKDSLGFQLLHYSAVHTTYGFQPNCYLIFNDTAVEFLSFETYSQDEYKNIASQLKGQHFRSLGADVNGNYITTVYDNDRLLLCQDYEAVENPVGKGHIPYYRYRIYRKYGKFDELNGEKTILLTENGTSYTGIRENYKNGVLSGERTLYYPDGTIKRKENYQAGRLNGLASDFDSAGRLIHSSVHSYHWKYGLEKWYDGQGKVIRSLQWQRDVPVGVEKYTINGRTFSGAAYKNGKKEGMATIPLGINWVKGFGVDRFPIPVDPDWAQAARAETEIKALETVNFVNNIKTGKAVGISPFSGDTLYTCYYKNGIIDSVFTAYQLTSFEISDKNVPVAQTTFVNGLENGKRTFWIRSGQYQDSISYEENYINGKLNGVATQFYSRSADMKQDWFPFYVRVNFTDGTLSGPFSQYQDSNNYQYGAYLNGKLDGKIEYSERTGQDWMKKTEYYKEGARSGEWTTNYLNDSLVLIEHFNQNQKNGIFSRTVKGTRIEERVYFSDTLMKITHFKNQSGSTVYTMHFNRSRDTAFIEVQDSFKDSITDYRYGIAVQNYPGKDTLLATIASAMNNGISFSESLNGRFQVDIPGSIKSGNYTNGKRNGLLTFEELSPCVWEELMYENGIITKYQYSNCGDKTPYNGTFFSMLTNEKVSVKNGLRHGWCIQYDAFKNEIRRTKYSKGVAKKTIEN